MTMAENLPEYLPAPEIQLQTELTSLSFEAASGGTLLNGGMTAGFGAAITADRVNSGEPLGAILEGTCGEGEFAFADLAGMESAVHLDTMNRALFAAWWNGAMAFPIETEELDANVTFSAPPVLTRCGVDGTLMLQVADTRMAGSYQTEASGSFTSYASASQPVQFELVGEDIMLVPIEGDSLFVMEVVSGSEAAGSDTALASAVEDFLGQGVLLDYLNATLASLPGLELDFAALYQLEDAAVLRLDAQSVEQSAGYLKVTGQVEGQELVD